MRTTLNLTIRADVKDDDPHAREVFEQVLRETAEVIYAQLALMSNNRPEIEVSISNDAEGTRDIELFTSGVA